MSQRIRYVQITFLLILGSCAVQAQQSDYAVEANIIYHLTKYIDWPLDKKKGDFVIGIIGDSPILDALKESVQNKTAGNNRIVIRKFSADESSYNCNILFISEEETKNLHRLLNLTQGGSVLIVTQAEGVSKRDYCINFLVVNNRLKLVFNKTNIEKRNLKIATELLSLGTVVE